MENINITKMKKDHQLQMGVSVQNLETAPPDDVKHMY